MSSYQCNKIKKRHSYDLEEVAELLNVNRRTISRWMKEGLEPMLPNRKPLLFEGLVLSNFLNHKKQDRKVPLQEDEFYCLPCHRAVVAQDKSVSIEKTGNKVGRNDHEQLKKKGICSKCGHRVNRFMKVSTTEIN